MGRWMSMGARDTMIVMYSQCAITQYCMQLFTLWTIHNFYVYYVVNSIYNSVHILCICCIPSTGMSVYSQFSS